MDADRFYREVATSLACDRERAKALTFVVFQEFRDHLTAKESSDVVAQLPKSLRQAWGEGEHPERPPHRIDLEEFVGRVRNRAVLPDDDEAMRAIRAVFWTLKTLLGSPTGQFGEAKDVASVLPKRMKKLWLDAFEPEKE